MSHDPEAPASLYQPADQTCLSLESAFTFHCHPGLACFNQCCRTPTILLSPYDLLRLKNCMGLESGELLERYTCREIEAESNLPLIFIDPFHSSEPGCPFLTAAGCAVYPYRPAACRLFPITMGSRLTRHGLEDYYFCRRLDYCRGFDSDVRWTVASWRTNQGFDEYEQGRREWLEILLKQGLRGQVEARGQRLFAALAYDLDRFRRMILDPPGRRSLDLDAAALILLRTDDLALLRFSYRCLKSFLFSEADGRLGEALQSLPAFNAPE